MTSHDSSTEGPPDARSLSRVLTRYRAPDPARNILELVVTLAPFLGIWAVAWWMLSYSTALAMLLALGNSAFLVRLFMIRPDCRHGSFFRSKRLCNWLGRAIGVETLTPYDVWRETHAIDHSTTGNLDRRGIVDLPTLAVAEYRAKGRIGRGLCRLVRHPPHHQFEHTSWNHEAEWNIRDAALEGVSHYDLPPVLRWITGNIGVHHVHHLASRIPFYRLPEVFRHHDALADLNRVTLRQSLGCVRLALWVESAGHLVTFAAAKRLPT